MKILIIGPSGSGKTTFAKKLTQKTKFPYFDLDNVYWNNDGDKKFIFKRTQEERVNLIHRITQHSDWIVDGIYTKDWATPVYEQADHILFIHTNLWLRDYRILKRFLKRLFGIEKNEPNGSIRALIALLCFNHRIEKDYRQKIDTKIKECGKTYMIIR